MIIKKLEPVHGGTFPGAAYNEKKVKEGVAELAGHANIDGNFLHTLHTLHSVGIDCGNEVEQYMQSRSQTFGNTRSTRFQLHLALSCKGQEKNKEQLVGIAHAMMKEYGAEKQPYLIYFHHDTKNNHVHILSTMVTSKGRMLSDHNDFARLNKALNRVTKEDMDNDLDRMFEYNFTTEGQLMNIARGFYYKIGEPKKEDDHIVFYHGGAKAFDVSKDKVAKRITEVKNDMRTKTRRENVAKRAKAIIIKYREQSLSQTPSATANKTNKSDKKEERAKTKKDLMKKKAAKIHPDIKKLTNADGKQLSKTEQYQLNWLIETLRSNFGIAVHFQKDKNGVVRGYGIVDHNNKVALNGSDVMKLADIVNFKQWQEAQQKKAEKAAKAKEAKKVEPFKPKQQTWNVPNRNTEEQVTQSRSQDSVKPIVSNPAMSEPSQTWQPNSSNGNGYNNWQNRNNDRTAKTSSEKVAPKSKQNQPASQPSSKPQQPAQPQPQQQKPKARIYQPDSTLDIYRPLFKAGIGNVDGKKIIRMQLDGGTYDHAITDNQRLWYASAPAEAHEDIAIRLAVFYFYKQIYDSYRRLLKNLYVKHESEGMELPNGSLRAYKQRSGIWCVALDYKGGTMQYELTKEESKLMNFADADGNKAELAALKERFFREKVAQHEVNDIASHLNYDDMKVYPSYAKDKDTIKDIKSFVNRHCQLMQKLANVLSVNTGSGINREFEVGGKRNRWSDIDDERSLRSSYSM